MGLISVSLPSDGTTAKVADYNVPITTIVTLANGNISDANVNTSAAIDGSKLAAGSIPAAKMVAAANPETRTSEMFFDHVASGGVWTGDSYGASLNASMTALVCYINGQRGTISAVTARAFTTNVDTYIDVFNSSGVFTLVYTTAATNTASPALAASSIRIGIIQAAATITAATKVNQGQEDRVFPIASSIAYAVTDSLGNLICPRDPTRKVLGYRQILTTYTTATTTITQITGLSVPVIVPTGRKIKVSAFSVGVYSTGGSQTLSIGLYDGVVGGTVIQEWQSSQPSGLLPNGGGPIRIITPTSASKTYNAGFLFTSGTGYVQANASNAACIMVELA